MSKKKKGKIVQLNSNQLSPEKYIQTQARSLPIMECLINDGWESVGICNVVVVRRHKTGNVTYALYLVDMYCLGVKDVSYYFNQDAEDYEDLKYNGPEWITIDYVLAHNIIYGSIEYAEDYGFKPHKDFAIGRFILEEDDDRVELMELEFGLDGKPCYMQGPYDDPVKVKNITATLERTAGKDNFAIVEEGDEDFDIDDDDWDDEDLDDDEFEKEAEEAFEEEERSFKIIFNFLRKLNKAYDELIRTPQAKDMLENYPIGRAYTLSEDVVKNKYNIFDTAEQEEDYNHFGHMILVDRKYDPAIKGLQKVIKKYPGKPVFYNMLRSAYTLNDQPGKADDITIETFMLFPDYLTAKVDYANMLIETGIPEGVLSVFDGKPDLNYIYPGIKKFNRTEAAFYYVCMFRYFISQDEIDSADLYMNAIIKKKLYEEYTLSTVKHAMTLLCRIKLEKIEEHKKNNEE
jgi:hypothetical protein